MKYPIVVYVFLGLFLVASILQFVFAFTENQRFRRKEKFACMLTLGTAAIFAFPDQPLIYVGAFLAMFGDIFVLRKKTFNIGVVCFFLSHLAYIFECVYIIIYEHLQWFHHVIFILTYLLLALGMFAILRKGNKRSMLNMFAQSFYFAILSVYLPVFGFAISTVGSYMFLCLIGSVVFIISDCILVWTHFGHKFKRYDFYIMLTYLIAEFLIVSGFTLTLIA